MGNRKTRSVGPPRRSAASVPRLFAMVVVIVLLALLLVVLRMTLVPAWMRAQPAQAGPSQDPNGVSTCPAGQDCAGEGGTVAERLTASEARLVDLVNAERRRAGCPALLLNDRLMASAGRHASDMANRAFADQINPDREGPEARARKLGYRGGVVEILAVGLPTVDQVLAQWTNPRNPAAAAVAAKMNDCSRVSVGVGYHPGRVKPTFGDGIWVLDMGDA